MQTIDMFKYESLANIFKKMSVNLVFALVSLFSILLALLYSYFNNVLNLKIAESVLIFIILLILANSKLTPSHLKAILGTGALLVSATILVMSTNGDYAAQLIFPVVIVTVTFYRDYFSYILSLVYITVFYFITTIVDPLILYKPIILALGVPYLWSFSVIIFSIIASGLSIIFWKINDRNSANKQQLAVALAESSLKQRQALDIHDNIVQGLSVAKYSLDMQEYDEASRALNSTLESAKKLIGSLSVDLAKGDPFLRYKSAEAVFDNENSQKNEKEN